MHAKGVADLLDFGCPVCCQRGRNLQALAIQEFDDKPQGNLTTSPPQAVHSADGEAASVEPSPGIGQSQSLPEGEQLVPVLSTFQNPSQHPQTQTSPGLVTLNGSPVPRRRVTENGSPVRRLQDNDLGSQSLPEGEQLVPALSTFQNASQPSQKQTSPRLVTMNGSPVPRHRVTENGSPVHRLQDNDWGSQSLPEGEQLVPVLSTSQNATQFSQTQMSPRLVTVNGSPVPRLQDNDWGLDFHDVSKAAGSVVQVDPMLEMNQQLARVDSVQALRAILYPAGLFKGPGYDLTSEKAVYQTVRRQLDGIMQCELSHVEVSSDPSFSLSRIATEPHRKAVNAVAVSNGWPAEALFQGFSANIGWLENVKTRLVDSEGSLHVRTPNIAAFMGGPPSTRKSSLHDFVTKWCVNHPDVAEDLRDGKALSCDGTIKGHRMALLSNCRSGTASAEGSSVYETPFSENTKGVNYVSRVKQLQFVNAERDSCVTAAGALSLDLYSYFHWVLAQIPVCEHILRPSETGFTKRFHILFCSGAECNAAQECQASREFLRNHCGWMGRKAEPFNQRHYPDGFAKSMMMSALKAAEEFRADAPAANRFWVQKVLFGDTDLSKFANVAMRSTQYCASLTQIPETDCVHTRMEYDVYEMASALHQWIR